MLEELLHSPKVLALFARHYKTGKPIPTDLVTRMNRASTFTRAEQVARLGGRSAISFDLYNGDPKALIPMQSAIRMSIALGLYASCPK